MMGNFSDLSVVGRFAPSPTGPLHFGSLVTAVGSYCLARRSGGRWLVRIEDLDTSRTVPGAADRILRTMEEFGFEWDGEVVYQSRRTARYEAALEQLRKGGLVFGCGCSRREIIASAPHAGEEGPVYPGTCRQGVAAGRRPRTVRIRVPDGAIRFVDGIFGPRSDSLAATVGDFVLKRADGLFAYQLAVVVDDADAGVNQVVRGADLLGSTARQIFILNTLEHAVPRYFHLPLALAPGGEKISKRHGPVPLGASGGHGAVLEKALRFLGQAVPAALAGAPARELLAWGAARFDPLRVPRASRSVDGEESAFGLRHSG